MSQIAYQPSLNFFYGNSEIASSQKIPGKERWKNRSDALHPWNSSPQKHRDRDRNGKNSNSCKCWELKFLFLPFGSQNQAVDWRICFLSISLGIIL
jgi:hypothetical protein